MTGSSLSDRISASGEPAQLHLGGCLAGQTSVRARRILEVGIGIGIAIGIDTRIKKPVPIPIPKALRIGPAVQIQQNHP